MKPEDWKVGHVYCKAFTSPIFKWANGLFVFLFIKDDVVYGVDIDKFGEAEMINAKCYRAYDDEIFPTNLQFVMDDKIKPDCEPPKPKGKLYHIKYNKEDCFKRFSEIHEFSDEELIAFSTTCFIESIITL